MKIALIQPVIVPGDREMNCRKIAKAVRAAAADGADIAVLPELWDVSFYPPDVLNLADVGGEKTKEFLHDLSEACHIQIVGGSVARREGETLYNTTYVFDEEGNLAASYDKCHLFTPGREDDVFTAGKRLNTFYLGDVPMASIICYDLRFGEWVRLAALSGAKILFVPAAWPVERLKHWQILNQARAIENQFFVAAVNSCGSCGAFHFGGHSMLIDPWGEIIEEGGDGEEIITAEIDLSQVDDIRRQINVFRDRRTDLYQLEGKR